MSGDATRPAAVPALTPQRIGASEFTAYWWQCTKEAAQGATAFANAWQWLFGFPVVSGVAGYVAARYGKTAITTGQPIFDGLLAALGAFLVTWLVAFVVRLFNAPVTRDREQRGEIRRLKELVGEVRSTSFGMEICMVHENDADRWSTNSEDLFRLAVTNLEASKTLKAYVLLENSPPELGISPAAKFPALGKKGENTFFTIAPSETAYVRVLQREDARNLFDSAKQPWVRFAADSSSTDILNIVTYMDRAENHIGELHSGETYNAVLAVHAAGAVSRRLPISVRLEKDGTVTVTSHEDACASA